MITAIKLMNTSIISQLLFFFFCSDHPEDVLSYQISGTQHSIINYGHNVVH